MKFLVLGSTGMAGHVIAIYLKEKGHKVVGFSRRPVSFCENFEGDAFDLRSLEQIIREVNYDAVINCIGVLNKDAEAEKDKAVFLNSYLPHFLSSISKDLSTKIIHLSTDCVFSGKTGGYFEKSFTDGETFYDRSKALGELENQKDLTFRNSIVGPDLEENGIGLFNWFMRQDGQINGYSRAIWTGVTTLTLAQAIETATINNLTGIYHLVNDKDISKFKLLSLFNRYFRDNRLEIKESEDVNINKSLINTRTDFKFEVPPYEDMISEMKDWIYRHKDLYPHYFH